MQRQDRIDKEIPVSSFIANIAKYVNAVLIRIRGIGHTILWGVKTDGTPIHAWDDTTGALKVAEQGSVSVSIATVKGIPDGALFADTQTDDASGGGGAQVEVKADAGEIWHLFHITVEHDDAVQRVVTMDYSSGGHELRIGATAGSAILASVETPLYPLRGTTDPASLTAMFPMIVDDTATLNITATALADTKILTVRMWGRKETVPT